MIFIAKIPETLTQDIYDDLKPGQRKSLKCGSGWLIGDEVDTTAESAGSRAN